MKEIPLNHRLIVNVFAAAITAILVLSPVIPVSASTQPNDPNTTQASSWLSNDSGNQLDVIRTGVKERGAFQAGTPTISINDVTLNEGNSGNTYFDFSIYLSSATDHNVEFTVEPSNGTAMAGSDYNYDTDTITIYSGDTSAWFSVQVYGDSIYEYDETFTVYLSSVTGATIADSSGTGTITNDDSPPQIYIDDSYDLSESGSHTFDVCLSSLSGVTASVHYATAHGTTNASDFIADSGTLSISAGNYCNTISVSINTDTLYEANETYYVNLSSPSGAIINDSQGVGTINNNDSAPEVSFHDVNVTEGNSGTVSVTIPAASGLDVDFSYAMFDDSAKSGSDYTSSTGSGKITAGSTSTTIPVSTLTDTVYEGNERFEVYLTDLVNANSSNSSAWVTIIDNDSPPTISVSNETIREGDDGIFTISLSEASAVDVSFEFETVNGTATSPSDYGDTSGYWGLLAGETSTEIYIYTNSDAVDEADETFTVRLYNITGAGTAVATGTGTITKPGLSISNVEITEGNVATFNVSLNSYTGLPVSFNYSTADGSAVAPGDYVSVAGGSGTIPAFANNTTITVNTTEDSAFEFDESFVVNLSNPVNAGLADGQATATIKDDDASADLSVTISDSPDPVIAGDNLTYTIFSLNSGPNPAILVEQNITLASGSTFFSLITPGGFSCTTPSVGATGTITCTVAAMEAGYSGTSTLVVKTATDLVTGSAINQTVSISASSLDPNVTNNSATATTGVYSRPLATTSAASNITASSATLNGLVNPLGSATTVSFDYGQTVSYGSSASVTGTFTGTSEQSVSANLTGLSPNTTYHFRAVAQNSTGTTYGIDRSFTTNSLNISINNVSKVEGNNGTSTLSFTVSLSEPAGATGVTFNIATGDYEATTVDNDYIAKSLTGQTIPAGSSSYTFDVTINGDEVAEDNERFVIYLTNIAGVTSFITGGGVGTIINDDTAGITVNPASGLITGEDGTADTFTIVLNSKPTADVSITFASSDSTEGTAAASPVSFSSSDWDTPKTVTVTGADDSLDDGNQVYTVQTNAASSTDTYYNGINPADVSVTNQDDDASGVEILTTTHNDTHLPISWAAVGVQVHASASITGNNPAEPTGTISFSMYQNVSCDGSALDGGTITLSAGVADMTTNLPMTSNGLSFRAHYSGDVTYPAADGTCTPVSTSEFPTVLINSSTTIPVDAGVVAPGITSIQLQFNRDVLHDDNANPNSVTYPGNYMLVEAGENGSIDTQSCLLGADPTDHKIQINSISYDSTTFRATVRFNNGNRLPVGSYRLFACGTTSIAGTDGNTFLNNHAFDSTVSFTVRAGSSGKKSVATGFTPGVITRLPEQPAEMAYAKSDLWIEIPELGLQQNIVGIPETDSGWDVSWLGNDVGYLQGTAFPTWAGNSVLTGHVTGADGQAGIFADLGTLGWGDQIIIHAFGQKYIYEVRTVNLWSSPDSTRVIGKHEELPWLTLITCRGYDEKSNQYRWRTVVRAVQVSVE